MKIEKLSNNLELDSYEVFKRIKRIEYKVERYLEEIDSNQKDEDIYLNSSDIRTITAISKYCRNNTKLYNEDCLLEIIILYYYMMDILHEDHNSIHLEYYFQINNFTNILINNISFFSKPYLQSKIN
jgi:hypothetical protein